MTNKMKLKTKAWAKEYIKNGLNGTETAIQFGKKGLKREVAKVIASENLTKPHYKRAILKELDNVGMNRQERARLMKRNATQRKSISASNQSLDMLNKIEGDYAPEIRNTITLSLKGEDLQRAIDSKIKELMALQAQNS